MRIPLKVLTEGALCVALSVALSFFKLFALPEGGSISLSILPILIFAFRHGGNYGVTAGAIGGIIRFMLEGYAVHPVQVFLDYPAASAAVGLAGYFKDKKLLGITLAVFCKMLSYVLSGVIFFAEYAPKGTNVWIYSIMYNGSYAVPEGIICAALALLLLPRLEKFT